MVTQRGGDSATPASALRVVPRTRSVPAIYAGNMRVTVDSELCQGHNRCYALAPQLFDVDDYGNAVVIGDGSVPPELEDKARLAVANCPEYAIAVSDDSPV
jgi:ferredoxin